MRIDSVQVQNYKCFLDTGRLTLGPGFNIFFGKNDAGKSALVEALGLRQGSRPHRSLATLPRPHDQPHPVSTISVRYVLSASELRSYLSQQRSIIVPKHDGDHAACARTVMDAAAEESTSNHHFETIWTNAEVKQAWFPEIGGVPSGSCFLFNNVASPRGLSLEFAGIQGGTIEDYSWHLAHAARDQTYVFRAERLNLGECPAAGTQVLRPDASNLADALNQLSSANPLRYERLMGHVRTIFPHVTQVTAPVVAGNMVRTFVWSVPLSSERADLAVPLAESGTGIGQVLAMLYVVVTSERPTTIVIDEPQSFLHPGAIRKLVEILRGYSQHQYVITTHSTMALSLTTQDCVFIVRRCDGVSSVTRIDPEKQDDLRDFLTEVGARLGDVFGADRILWVEGKTEEVCFAELIAGLGATPLSGTQILGVISTDELASKKTERVFDIYRKLSSGPSLLPPALAFVFDREGRSERECQDIDRKSGGLVHWLPARMYENYLLVPPAIAKFLATLCPSDGKPSVGADAVAALLAQHMADRSYYVNRTPPDDDADCWTSVDGARVLKELVYELTGGTYSYDKVRHGLALTRLLVQEPTPEIAVLARLLTVLVSSEQKA